MLRQARCQQMEIYLDWKPKKNDSLAQVCSCCHCGNDKPVQPYSKPCPLQPITSTDHSGTQMPFAFVGFCRALMLRRLSKSVYHHIVCPTRSLILQLSHTHGVIRATRCKFPLVGVEPSCKFRDRQLRL